MTSDDTKAHVSPNRVQGELSDAPLGKVLEDCHRFLITGRIRVVTPSGEGVIVLRAGAVDEASWDELADGPAVERMKTLRQGTYYLAQRLPNIDGELGDAAECHGDLGDFPLVEIMRHCENEALSCTITVTTEMDEGEIVYKVGEIAEVTLNGKADPDRISDIIHFEKGKFKIVAPPLSFDIEGWPSVQSDPTEPFEFSRHNEPFRPEAEASPTEPETPADDLDSLDPDTLAPLSPSLLPPEGPQLTYVPPIAMAAVSLSLTIMFWLHATGRL
jgi:hypothetical protein